MADRLLPCAAARGQLSALLDGELPARRASAIGVHLDACPGCAGEHEALRRLRAQLRAMPVREAPAGLYTPPAGLPPSPPTSAPPPRVPRVVAPPDLGGPAAGTASRSAVAVLAAVVALAGLTWTAAALRPAGGGTSGVQVDLADLVADHRLATAGGAGAGGAVLGSTPITPITTLARRSLPVSATGQLAALRAAGWALPEQLPLGYDLVDVVVAAETAGRPLQAVYSDGIRSVSVFARSGRADPAALPPGGVPVAGLGARHWPGLPDAMLWTGSRHTFAVVGDAPDDELATLAAAVAAADAG